MLLVFGVSMDSLNTNRIGKKFLQQEHGGRRAKHDERDNSTATRDRHEARLVLHHFQSEAAIRIPTSKREQASR